MLILYDRSAHEGIDDLDFDLHGPVCVTMDTDVTFATLLVAIHDSDCMFLLRSEQSEDSTSKFLGRSALPQ